MISKIFQFKIGFNISNESAFTLVFIIITFEWGKK